MKVFDIFAYIGLMFEGSLFLKNRKQQFREKQKKGLVSLVFFAAREQFVRMSIAGLVCHHISQKILIEFVPWS